MATMFDQEGYPIGLSPVECNDCGKGWNAIHYQTKLNLICPDCNSHNTVRYPIYIDSPCGRDVIASGFSE